jgi:hypothetical protein
MQATIGSPPKRDAERFSAQPGLQAPGVRDC